MEIRGGAAAGGADVSTAANAHLHLESALDTLATQTCGPKK